MDTIQVYDHKIADLREIHKKLPILIQTESIKPNLQGEQAEFTEGKNTSMILEHAKKVLKSSLDDYEEVSNRKPTNDLEEINKARTDDNNYLTKRVPAQLTQIMFYIEALIHRDNWDKQDFGDYKQVYLNAKEMTGWDRASKLAELRMCLMWAIPQDEYYSETQVIDPMFGSQSRTIESV